MRYIIVPLTPGTLCALGLLLTDLRANFAVSRLLALEPSAIPAVQDAFDGLAIQANTWFSRDGIAEDRRVVTLTADMRYAGQNYELSVAVPPGPITPDTLKALETGFAAAHQQRFGFIAEGEAIQIVTLRTEAAGLVKKAEFVPRPDAGPDASSAIIDMRQIYMAELGDFVESPVYQRDKLKPGNRFIGPAIVEQMDATTVVLPGMKVHVDAYLNLILEAAE